MTYQPMLEVLSYLRANGFKNFIVSGGGIEFMRPWTERVYGVPPEQVVGSSIKTKFEMREGKPVLVRLPELNFNIDKADKPVGINAVYRPPSDCRIRELPWRQGNAGIHAGGRGRAVHVVGAHDDAAREYAYGPALGLPEPRLGAFPQALYEQAKKQGWTVVSMKNDWNQVFPFEPSPVRAAVLIYNVVVELGINRITAACSGGRRCTRFAAAAWTRCWPHSH